MFLRMGTDKKMNKLIYQILKINFKHQLILKSADLLVVDRLL